MLSGYEEDSEQEVSTHRDSDEDIMIMKETPQALTTWIGKHRHKNVPPQKKNCFLIFNNTSISYINIRICISSILPDVLSLFSFTLYIISHADLFKLRIVYYLLPSAKH